MEIQNGPFLENFHAWMTIAIRNGTVGKLPKISIVLYNVEEGPFLCTKTVKPKSMLFPKSPLCK